MLFLLQKITEFCLYFRFPLPELKLSSSWNVGNTSQNLSVQEKFIKYKQLPLPKQNTTKLDKIVARSNWFSELDSYWYLPLSDNSVVTALSVRHGLKQDGTDDRIDVLSANPLCLHSYSLNSDKLKEIYLQGLISPISSNKPRYNLAHDKNDNVIVHEESVSMLKRQKNIWKIWF